MKRLFKILGLSMVIVAILALAIAGTASAAGGDLGTRNQTRNCGVVCPCGECPCGDCVCADCDPIGNFHNHGCGL